MEVMGDQVERGIAEVGIILSSAQAWWIVRLLHCIASVRRKR